MSWVAGQHLQEEPAETLVTRSDAELTSSTVVTSMGIGAGGSAFKSQLICCVCFRPTEPQFSCTLKPKVTQKWPPIITEKRSRANLWHFCQIQLPSPANVMTCPHSHTFRLCKPPVPREGDQPLLRIGCVVLVKSFNLDQLFNR